MTIMNCSFPWGGRFFCLFLIVFACLLISGCDEGKGTSTPVQVLNPAISDLTVTGNKITRSAGGILTLACNWTNPGVVYSAAAYLAYSTTLIDTSNGPTGVLASGTASSTNIVATIRSGFKEEFATPLVIPTAISSSKTEGYWRVEIPLASGVTSDAPLGKNQMLLWMVLNGRKSNTLAFELEFVAGSSTSNLRAEP